MKAFVSATATFPARPGEQVTEELLTGALSMRGLRPLSRTARLAMVAAAEVFHPESPAGDRTGVVLGSAWSSVGPLAEFVQVAAEHGPDRVFPMAFPNTVVSVHAGYVAALLGITGPVATVCGEHSGLEAVVEAVSWLDGGRADRVCALGVEAAEAVTRAARPGQAESAAAVRLSVDPEDMGCLAVVTDCRLAPDISGFPAALRRDAVESRELAGEPGLGATAGTLAFARAAALVGRDRAPVLLVGRSGVRGVAALRLEPA